jgi:hypothetical protein
MRRSRCPSLASTGCLSEHSAASADRQPPRIEGESFEGCLEPDNDICNLRANALVGASARRGWAKSCDLRPRGEGHWGGQRKDGRVWGVVQ